MGVPISQMWAVTRHVWSNRLRGIERYPIVLMLEPLFRCNLACIGCGKIQYPSDVLKKQLTPDECFRAAEECGAPIVSIPGGEPLLHPEIDEIVRGLVARKKFVYLCTNALLLEKSLDRFQPSQYLALSVHLDGPRSEHDRSVGRDSVYDTAVRAIKEALARGFRVTTNSTFFNTADPETCRQFFDDVMAMGVEGMTISPGYPYQEASDQSLFLHTKETIQLFRQILEPSSRKWKFNQSPLFLEFLKDNWPLDCTPWGNPTYNIFGWQRPCYLLQEGYVQTFQELLETTDWESYGRQSGNPNCADCMLHCGYEPTAVAQSLTTVRGMLKTVLLMLRHAIFSRRITPNQQSLTNGPTSAGRSEAA